MVLEHHREYTYRILGVYVRLYAHTCDEHYSILDLYNVQGPSQAYLHDSIKSFQK